MAYKGRSMASSLCTNTASQVHGEQYIKVRLADEEGNGYKNEGRISKDEGLPRPA